MKLPLYATLFLTLHAIGGQGANIRRRWSTGGLLEQTGQGNHEEFGTEGVRSELSEMLDALEVMQDTYFDMFTGTWPDAIDWTAAVMGTHVSATLSSLVLAINASSPSDAVCSDLLAWQNIVDRYFAQTSVFYFGENAFALQYQAFDDMLWVVLGWLENIKFGVMYSLKQWNSASMPVRDSSWHGLQTSPMAAHRARIFYNLASSGWDESLCGGGMTWNPQLTPYKNAITNELFAAASIAMYFYFPGDNNTSPYFASGTVELDRPTKPHDPIFLENAIKSYKWLKESQMQHPETGLYQDGFHVSGWQKFRNGTINPGTGNCDELNSMVYTYNQGVILSASRGLWMATGARSYLEDGHGLVESVIRATGWPIKDRFWHGLGRAGVLEEFCDHGLYCSQDGQTFKGIFFHHLSEFCRPLWPHEEEMISTLTQMGFDRAVYKYHLDRCEAYGKWISHNARAATATKNDDGLFGMWWRHEIPTEEERQEINRDTTLPRDADDHLNPVILPSEKDVKTVDLNDRGRGRTVETQSGGLAVLRAAWNWRANFG